jgi:hypothetical protein
VSTRRAMARAIALHPICVRHIRGLLTHKCAQVEVEGLIQLFDRLLQCVSPRRPAADSIYCEFIFQMSLSSIHLPSTCFQTTTYFPSTLVISFCGFGTSTVKWPISRATS